MICHTLLLQRALCCLIHTGAQYFLTSFVRDATDQHIESAGGLVDAGEQGMGNEGWDVRGERGWEMKGKRMGSGRN